MPKVNVLCSFPLVQYGPKKHKRVNKYLNRAYNACSSCKDIIQEIAKIKTTIT